MVEARTKEDAIRLIQLQLERERGGRSSGGKENRKKQVASSTSARVNALLYPDECSFILSPEKTLFIERHDKGSIEEEETADKNLKIKQFELHDTFSFEHPPPSKQAIATKPQNTYREDFSTATTEISPLLSSSARSHKDDSSSGHPVLVSNFDIKDIHVDDTSDPAPSSNSKGYQADFLLKCPDLVEEAVDRLTHVMDQFPMAVPTLEDLLEQSCIIDDAHHIIQEYRYQKSQEVDAEMPNPMQKTPVAIGPTFADTPSTLVKLDFQKEPNPFLSPGVNKPACQLYDKFIQDDDYWLYLLLTSCNQRRVIPFSQMMQFFEASSSSDKVQTAAEGGSLCDRLAKIGESSYSEVYLCQDEPSPFVMKVIPVRTSLNENDDHYYLSTVYKDGSSLPYASRALDVFHEVLMTKQLSQPLVDPSLTTTTESSPEMTTSTGFIYCCGAYVVQGAYPALLQNLWDKFKAEKGSDNLSPSNFQKDQHYIVLLLSYGGYELEKFSFTKPAQILSILHQLILAVLYAEKNFEFEHRDLHGGNILVQHTSEFVLTMPSPFGESIQVQTHGVEMRIIDYTLSRMKAQKHASTKGISQPEHLLFSDLDKDPELFKGDASTSYQYEIYRQMKELVQKNHTSSELLQTSSNNNPHVFHHATPVDCIWTTYCPKTNALWIWYCLKFILIPKLNSPVFRKISTFKRTLTTLALSLHQQVISGSASLQQWYSENMAIFLDFSSL